MPAIFLGEIMGWNPGPGKNMNPKRRNSEIKWFS
jgi:hypothetical protein